MRALYVFGCSLWPVCHADDFNLISLLVCPFHPTRAHERPLQSAPGVLTGEVLLATGAPCCPGGWVQLVFLWLYKGAFLCMINWQIYWWIDWSRSSSCSSELKKPFGGKHLQDWQRESSCLTSTPPLGQRWCEGHFQIRNRGPVSMSRLHSVWPSPFCTVPAASLLPSVPLVMHGLNTKPPLHFPPPGRDARLFSSEVWNQQFSAARERKDAVHQDVVVF